MYFYTKNVNYLRLFGFFVVTLQRESANYGNRKRDPGQLLCRFTFG